MEKRMRSCIAAQSAAPSYTSNPPPRTKPCTEQEMVLGICKR